MCHQKEIHTCAGCKSAKYCPSFCQKQDWPLHKFLCKQYGQKGETILKSKPPGDKKHALCILFPQNGLKPSLVWLEVTDLSKSHSDLLNRTFEKVEADNVLGAGWPNYMRPVSSNFESDKTLAHTLFIYTQLRNEMIENKCLD